jgi:hypothetical protein
MCKFVCKNWQLEDGDGGGARRLIAAHGHEDFDHSAWFETFTPQPLDGCYVDARSGGAAPVAADPREPRAVCWWHMADGKVLGVHDGELKLNLKLKLLNVYFEVSIVGIEGPAGAPRRLLVARGRRRDAWGV